MNLHTMPFPPQRRTRDHRLALFLLSAFVILADRLTKLWIVAHIPNGSARVIIPGVFRLTHVLNSGAAFSIFADSVSPNAVRYGLIGFSVVAVLIVLAMLWRTGQYLNASTIALALILGGAIGNLYDRARLYFVVDFLEVTIVHYHWPDFNVADSCIVIGACLLLLEIIRRKPPLATEVSCTIESPGSSFIRGAFFMATTIHGDPQPVALNSHDERDEESWDENIEALLASGDIEGARAEFERQCLASLGSGDPILMTPEKWEELRLELHREANLPS